MQALTTTTEPIRWIRPAFDVFEGEADWLLVADLPGVTADQLEVTLHAGELVVEAKTGEHGFRRAFKVPDGATEVEATLRDGALTLKLQRPVEQRPRRIPIAT